MMMVICKKTIRTRVTQRNCYICQTVFYLTAGSAETHVKAGSFATCDVAEGILFVPRADACPEKRSPGFPVVRE